MVNWASHGASMLLGTALPLLYFNVLLRYLPSSPGHDTDAELARALGRRWAQQRRATCGPFRLEPPLWDDLQRQLAAQHARRRARVLAWSVPSGLVLLALAVALLVRGRPMRPSELAVTLATDVALFLVLSLFELCYIDGLRARRSASAAAAPAPKAA